MKVELLAHTPQVEQLCEAATRVCRSQKGGSELFDSNSNKTAVLRKVMKWGHTSVIEHASFTFSIEGISRSCSHQLVRHRIASYSQQSQRHVVIGENSEWFVIPPSIEGTSNEEKFIKAIKTIEMHYHVLIDSGVKKEDARFLLPNATKTNIVVTMNARALLNFFTFRLASDAQWEIRELAHKMYALVQPLAPSIFPELAEWKLMPDLKKEIGEIQV